MKYFVSYTTRDKEITRSLLETISSDLKRTGEVFVDLIDNNSMDRQARVMDELDSCDVLILIESANVYKSDWVSIEVERAKSRRIPIRSIKIEDLKQFSVATFFDHIHNFRVVNIGFGLPKYCY